MGVNLSQPVAWGAGVVGQCHQLWWCELAVIGMVISRLWIAAGVVVGDGVADDIAASLDIADAADSSRERLIARGGRGVHVEEAFQRELEDDGFLLMLMLVCVGSDCSRSFS